LKILKNKAGELIGNENTNSSKSQIIHYHKICE